MIKTKEKSNKKIGCYLLKKSKFIFHVYREKQPAPFVPVKKTG